MTVFEMVGLISTITLVIPILILFAFKLAWYRSFPGLVAFFAILFTCNLVLLNYVKVSPAVSTIHEILHNLLEQPMVLFFLTYFSRTPGHRKQMMIALYSLIGFELVIVGIYGLTAAAFNIIKVPAYLLTLFYSVTFFIHQVKLAITYQKAVGKALMVCSILFATIGFSYVNAALYFTDDAAQKDADLIFFLITIFSSLSISAGLLLEQKRVKQLAEIKTAREELKALYGDENEKATTPVRTVALNFDKEPWK